MRNYRCLSVALLGAGLLFATNARLLADGAEKATKKPTNKVKGVATLAVPIHAPRTTNRVKARIGGTRRDTIKEYRNALGQTVYEVTASHFDVSAPLAEMAAMAVTEHVEESESAANPPLPAWLSIRADVPDPVVQVVPSSDESLAPGDGPAVSAPVVGFNFSGVGGNIPNFFPSDSNGSTGGNQFVETVNIRYQVWSLNRSTHVATSLLGPSPINTLWAGFGGACQDQNSGDPIVLFDKVAGRWLISQLTLDPVDSSFYECVAVSTTANATGTYRRYAFALPDGYIGDYPHYGVWSDAYYMTGNAFTSEGGYVAAIFAAMDRTKMIAGDPSATWQVILDPSEGGHMPADLDGFAPPPTGAPGIFVSRHGNGMAIHRMKVDFVTPSNTLKTLQAIVPVAPATAACGGGTCIPQPGSSVKLATLSSVLMFRAAYRNFVDHESLVISHSVDPSVSGVVSGVRWYDFRLSGTPNATCPSYPCIYQQGTIADVANGRSRWMPSIAMDGAENILVGYSTSGTSNGTDNHSIRYTGRAKSDPVGAMTVPETTIVTGTANNTSNSGWGDYGSMSIDPFDDCTFWYVNQYYTSSTWSTRIASSTWPGGTGAGRCPVTQCFLRPTTVPTIGTATVPGDNQISVTWTGVAPTPGSYAIERADGVCGSEGLYRPLAFAPGTASSFVDTTVLGGLSYSYRVIAASDASGRCQSLLASGCAGATATGACNLAPVFAGASDGTSSNGSNCGVDISWAQASPSCPLTPSLRYNIFRGTMPDFVPSLANRIATCVAGPSAYVDTANLTSGVTYYYVVRAEDNSTGHGGECNGGNEDANSAVAKGTAYGVGTQPVPGTWSDGGGDVTAFLRLNVIGAGDTGDPTWRFVRTADDPGANHTPGGAYAYRNAGPTASSTYFPRVCAEMQSPLLTAAASTINLQYWERHQIEYHVDGLAVEYARNGGAWTDAPAPSNDPSLGCALTDDTTGWETLSCSASPPLNACGYPAAKNALNGPLESGTGCNNWATSGALTDYAHRCHPISGLNPGDSIQFRWRFSSDVGTQYAGFYLDDIAVANVAMPNACVPDTCAGQPDATPCDAGVACSTGDVCSGGTCQAGPVSPLPEISGVQVNGHSNTTLTWTASHGPAGYDIASSTLSDLTANGTATATCLANDLGAAGFVDSRPDPPAGNGYYYLVRAQNACGTGTYGLQSNGSPRSPTGCP